jgi:hypothetical protein
LKLWPAKIEIRSIVRRGLYERDGYLSILHETQLPNDGSTLHPRRIHNVKRVIGLVFSIGVASCVGTATSSPALAAGTSTPPSAPASQSASKAPAKPSVVVLAPADEYFGPLKLSYIGMRNTIRDLGLRYDVNHDIASQTLASALLTERAVRDWESKYPHDTQIPKTIYLLQRLYTKVLTLDARAHAHACALWLFGDYGKSGQARQLRKTLAVEHLQPLTPPVQNAQVLTPPASAASGTMTGSAAGTTAVAPASPAPAGASSPSTSDVTTIH